MRIWRRCGDSAKTGLQNKLNMANFDVEYAPRSQRPVEPDKDTIE